MPHIPSFHLLVFIQLAFFSTLLPLGCWILTLQRFPKHIFVFQMQNTIFVFQIPPTSHVKSAKQNPGIATFEVDNLVLLLSDAFPSSLVGHLETCRGRCGGNSGVFFKVAKIP